MNVSPFINIHTHKAEVGQAVSIENVFVQQRHEIIPQGLYSLGLHPWHISTVVEDFELEKTLNHYITIDSALVAIGEIGLDRSISTSFELQIEVFEQQLLLAESFKLPVIIHCVRAYSDLIRIKKKLGISVPMIVHDYCGNEQITKELLKFDFSFSFGKQLYQNNKNAISALIFVPNQSVFFETDDSQYSIEKVYQCASNFKNISIDIFKNAVCENFTRCFMRYQLLKNS